MDTRPDAGGSGSVVAEVVKVALVILGQIYRQRGCIGCKHGHFSRVRVVTSNPLAARSGEEIVAINMVDARQIIEFEKARRSVPMKCVHFRTSRRHDLCRLAQVGQRAGKEVARSKLDHTQMGGVATLYAFAVF